MLGLFVLNKCYCVIWWRLWKVKVHSMCINGSSLFLSNQRGISRLDLSTRQHSLIIRAPNDPCILAKFGSDLLYTNQKSCSVWRLQSTGNVKVFAGKEEGSLDRLVTTCRFRQPMGIATEFGKRSVCMWCANKQHQVFKLLSRLSLCKVHISLFILFNE